MQRVLVIHKGGRSGIRGSEVCLIEAITAMVDSGFSVSLARNLPVIDHLVKADRILAIEVPDLLVGDAGTRFGFGRYIKSLLSLRKEVRDHGVNIIYASGGLPCQLGVVLARLCGVPVICHLHHPAGRRYLLAWLANRADGYLFPSEFTRGFLHSKIGIGGDVVYNGIDVQRFSPTPQDPGLRTHHGVPADAIVVGQVGALVPHKRADFLLRAIAASSDQRLWACIVGRGVLEGSLRELAAELGIANRVVITGGVEDVAPYYQHVFDINALASNEEGLGLAVLEGSAVGLPSVAADCTGLRETIVDERTGYLFPTDSLSSLTASLEKLAVDGALRARLGAEGREFVCERFASERFRAGVIDAIRRHLPAEARR